MTPLAPLYNRALRIAQGKTAPPSRLARIATNMMRLGHNIGADAKSTIEFLDHFAGTIMIVPGILIDPYMPPDNDSNDRPLAREGLAPESLMLEDYSDCLVEIGIERLTLPV